MYYVFKLYYHTFLYNFFTSKAIGASFEATASIQIAKISILAQSFQYKQKKKL